MNYYKNLLQESPPDSRLELHPRGLGAAYFEKLKYYRNRVFQIDADSNEKQTYNDILLQSVTLAKILRCRGLSETDIISTCTNNHTYSILPILAASYLLVKVASLDISLSVGEMRHMINLVKPRMIFCIPEVIPSLESALEMTDYNCELVVFTKANIEKHTSFNNFLKETGDISSFEITPVQNLFDTSNIFFSSGTTGLPKAICLNHYGLQYTSKYLSEKFDQTMSLNFTSPYWISHHLSFTACIFAGGCRVISKNLNAKSIFEIIENYKVTQMYLQPAFTFNITSYKNPKIYDTSSLKQFLTGGSTISSEQVKRICNVFPNAIVYVGYGLTEISGLFSFFNPFTDSELAKHKLGSSGRMLPGHSCKIVDPESGKLCGPYEIGELLIKSKTLMNGYYLNPEITKQSFDEDGYLRTGDIVYFDEDGCFYVIDRIKEMFKYRSWHILPAELESILISHPAVKEAIIIGYPDEEDGDRPMALIILQENFNLKENEIITYFNEQVSDRKKLRGGVKFVKHIIKTSTGKYNRREMRKLVIENKI